MTVKELRDILADLAADVTIAVECENRCDPHPVTSAHGGKRVLYLFQNDRVDINRNTGKPRKAER
jgi:hypothetical protein